MRIVEIRNIHFVEGLPRGLEEAYRGITFVVAAVALGMLIGVLRSRRSVDGGTWWQAAACALMCSYQIVTSVERWSFPISLESLLMGAAVCALLVALLIRVRHGTIGLPGVSERTRR